MQQAMTAPKESAGLNRLIHLIDYYFSLGGMQMQFNVVSRDTLLRAQANPEKYQNLIVRVAGYSAYFVNLEKRCSRILSTAQNSTSEKNHHLAGSAWPGPAFQNR